jgi:hypothetical protein
MPGSAVYDAVLGAYTLKQCQMADYSPNGQVIHGKYSGGIDPVEIYAGICAPMASFETEDVAGMLGGLSVTAGLSVSSGTITLPWQRRAQHGTYAGSGSHVTLTCANGLIVPLSISAQQGANASAQVAVSFRSDSGGLADPVTYTSGASLSAQAYGASYTLGPCSLDSVAIPEVMAVTVNTGITVTPEYSDGGLWPTELYITDRTPWIELTFKDLDFVTSVDTWADMANLVVYMRKRSDGAAGAGGVFIPAATAQHIKFSFADGIASMQRISASGQQTGGATVRFYGETLVGSATNAIS